MVSYLSQWFTEWMSHGNMTDTLQMTFLAIIEAAFSSVCPVYKLIKNDNFTRVDVFLKRSASGGDNKMGAALLFQSQNIGPVVYERRAHTMLSVMPVNMNISQ